MYCCERSHSLTTVNAIHLPMTSQQFFWFRSVKISFSPDMVRVKGFTKLKFFREFTHFVTHFFPRTIQISKISTNL